MENPTSEEKVMAALAHASVIFSFLGPVGPTVIWAYQRGKSKYVRFHALQAMGYQAFFFWAWMISIFFIAFGGALLSIVLVALAENEADISAFPFIVQPIMVLSMFGLWGIFFLGGILGAAFCMTNRDFRYPFIGRWLGRKLLDADSEEWEDNWVGGVCHSTVILQMWGIIIPLVIWITQKERSAKIRFQALQAIFYQLIAVVANVLGTVGGVVIYLVFIGGILVAASVGSSNGNEISPMLGILLIVFMGGFMLFWLISMVAIPLYYLLAAIASIQTIRGHDFKYPILGSMIARRIGPPGQKETAQT
ncbi:MAG: DUF4870 domain-containing protein [Chloroflexota bacterium]